MEGTLYDHSLRKTQHLHFDNNKKSHISSKNLQEKQLQAKFGPVNHIALMSCLCIR
jgi:hypothetical protein